MRSHESELIITYSQLSIISADIAKGIGDRQFALAVAFPAAVMIAMAVDASTANPNLRIVTFLAGVDPGQQHVTGLAALVRSVPGSGGCGGSAPVLPRT